MKTHNEVGFTIIETMLFLGITGLLVMGILTGTGVSINIQRYRDSVTSLQATLQQQFSDVSNVSNDSAGDLACHGATKARGQSDCVLLGRFITATTSRVLSIKNVIGYIDPNMSLAQNDLSALSQFEIYVSAVGAQEYTIEWGSSLVGLASTGSNPAVFSMLILRSPVSGVIRTFIDSTKTISDAKIADLLSASPSALTQSVNVCVDSNGLFAGGKSSVVVNSNATGASAIETRGEAISGC